MQIDKETATLGRLQSFLVMTCSNSEDEASERACDAVAMLEQLGFDG